MNAFRSSWVSVLPGWVSAMGGKVQEICCILGKSTVNLPWILFVCVCSNMWMVKVIMLECKRDPDKRFQSEMLQLSSFNLVNCDWWHIFSNCFLIILFSSVFFSPFLLHSMNYMMTKWMSISNETEHITEVWSRIKNKAALEFTHCLHLLNVRKLHLLELNTENNGTLAQRTSASERRGMSENYCSTWECANNFE